MVAWMSSFTDALASAPVDESKWNVFTGGFGPIYAEDGRVRLHISSYLNSNGVFDFDSVWLSAEIGDMGAGGFYFAAYQSPPGLYEDTAGILASPRYMQLSILWLSPAGMTLQASWGNYDATWEAGSEYTEADYTETYTGYGFRRVAYDATAMRYLRMTNSAAGGRVVCQYLYSADGRTWSTLFEFNAAPDDTYGYRVSLASPDSSVYVSSLNCYSLPFADIAGTNDTGDSGAEGGEGGGGSGYPDLFTPIVSADPTAQTPRAPRTLNLAGIVPAREQACTSLLDLIREFSGAVRAAVRIVDGSTIEMVDPDEPLPDGMYSGQGDHYYSRYTQTVKANTPTLYLSSGYMDLTVSADVVVNDAGIIVGGFRIPARLPVPNLDPAPVSRISYTFTPVEFRASVEMAYPDTPLIVRER